MTDFPLAAGKTLVKNEGIGVKVEGEKTRECHHGVIGSAAVFIAGQVRRD